MCCRHCTCHLVGAGGQFKGKGKGQEERGDWGEKGHRCARAQKEIGKEGTKEGRNHWARSFISSCNEYSARIFARHWEKQNEQSKAICMFPPRGPQAPWDQLRFSSGSLLCRTVKMSSLWVKLPVLSVLWEPGCFMHHSPEAWSWFMAQGGHPEKIYGGKRGKEEGKGRGEV